MSLPQLESRECGRAARYLVDSLIIEWHEAQLSGARGGVGCYRMEVWWIMAEVRIHGWWVSLRWALTKPIWRMSLQKCGSHTLSKCASSNPKWQTGAPNLLSHITFSDSLHLSCLGPTRMTLHFAHAATHNPSLWQSKGSPHIDALMAATLMPMFVILDACINGCQHDTAMSNMLSCSISNFNGIVGQIMIKHESLGNLAVGKRVGSFKWEEWWGCTSNHSWFFCCQLV